MDFGCRIWDEDGNLILNTTDYTARLVYSIILDGTESGSAYIPEANGNKPFVLAAPASSSISGHCLSVSISTSGTLTWECITDYNGNIVSDTTLILVYVCDEKV